MVSFLHKHTHTHTHTHKQTNEDTHTHTGLMTGSHNSAELSMSISNHFSEPVTPCICSRQRLLWISLWNRLGCCSIRVCFKNPVHRDVLFVLRCVERCPTFHLTLSFRNSLLFSHLFQHDSFLLDFWWDCLVGLNQPGRIHSHPKTTRLWKDTQLCHNVQHGKKMESKGPVLLNHCQRAIKWQLVYRTRPTRSANTE